MSAFPPSAAMVKAARQFDLAPSGNVSKSFSAALIHETGRVLLVICRRYLTPVMLSYLTTPVNCFRAHARDLKRLPMLSRDCGGRQHWLSSIMGTTAACVQQTAWHADELPGAWIRDRLTVSLAKTTEI